MSWSRRNPGERDGGAYSRFCRIDLELEGAGADEEEEMATLRFRRIDPEIPNSNQKNLNFYLFQMSLLIAKSVHISHVRKALSFPGNVR